MAALDAVVTVSQFITWPKRLFALVIRRATVDMVLYKNHPIAKLAKVGRDAHIWVFGDPEIATSHGPFERMCADLNLEPTIVRQKIVDMPEDVVRSLRGLDFADGEEETEWPT